MYSDQNRDICVRIRCFDDAPAYADSITSSRGRSHKMKVSAVGPQMRAFTLRVRQFSAQPQFTHPSVVFVKEAAGRGSRQ
ncbi:hypothetical protein ANCDUO_14534 [Ancylostoma duodenale]|uniref:Uncharacterized protein n=1 Tax=Ancylostoma duodenale TaxID=51022 RepID=A0A0C2GDZ1_9BILA|nr:hypothetical protein ANCDUO_14534 [Ancylostoma duodenale]